MKHTSKKLTALSLVLLLLLSACRCKTYTLKVNTIEELVGYVSLFTNYPTRHPEVESGKEYAFVDSLHLSCTELDPVDNPASTYATHGPLYLKSTYGKDAANVLSQLLELISDNIDEVIVSTDPNFPQSNTGSESKMVDFIYHTPDYLLSIIVVLDCNCGCSGELWLLAVENDDVQFVKVLD